MLLLLLVATVKTTANQENVGENESITLSQSMVVWKCLFLWCRVVDDFVNKLRSELFVNRDVCLMRDTLAILRLTGFFNVTLDLLHVIMRFKQNKLNNQWLF